MKKLSLFISILLFACKGLYAQTVTGAISIFDVCGNFGVDGGTCNQSTMYTILPPMTISGVTNYSGNCGASATCPSCNGTAATDHIQAYTAVWIPPTCVVTIVTEYGAPYNANSNCVDSRAEADGGRPDALCIQSAGTGVSPTALSVVGSKPVAVAEKNSAESATAANIGTCSFGAGGNGGGATLNGGATGLNSAPAASVCWLSGGSGNADLLCTKTGFAGGGSGTWVNLWYMANRSDEIMTYTITPTSGTCTDIGVIVLPVEIIAFAAYKTADNNIMVAWATATETNNNYFMVEYSLDGQIFIPYKEVKGAGSSSSRKDYVCNFNADIENGTPYFRLKQVDYNGNFKYSQIILLGTSHGALKSKDFNLVAYYNADSDKVISKFKLEAPAMVNITLYDVAGQEISTTNASFNEGDNELLISAPDKGGIYFLVYQNGALAPVHKKIMINK